MNKEIEETRAAKIDSAARVAILEKWRAAIAELIQNTPELGEMEWVLYFQDPKHKSFSYSMKASLETSMTCAKMLATNNGAQFIQVGKP